MPILGILASAQIGANSNSYESIATTVVGSGGTSTITFSSIPQTYKHLQVRLMAKAAPTATDAAYDLLTRFNGDTTIANYGTHYLYGNGNGGTGSGYTGNLGILGLATGSSVANCFGNNIIDILDYTSTSKYKVAKNLNGFDTNGSGQQITLQSYLWRNTAAITSIEFVFRTGPSFAQYTHAALYGIKG